MISIVCPFYNERDNLKELYTQLKKAVLQLSEPWEIIFVDDGSTDGGSDLLRSLISPNEPTRIIQFEGNRGKSSALHAGFLAARGEVLVTLDADLQNPPEEIPKLVSLIDDCDMVLGIRTTRQDNRFKKFTSKIANKIRQAFLEDHIQDIGCGLCCFRKEVVESFYLFEGVHRFFPAIAEQEGFRVKEVPVRHAPRYRGKTKYSLGIKRLWMFWDLASFCWMLKNKIRLKERGKT